MAHDVFISYSTHDNAIADAACAALESAKIRCWIAPRDILPGENWSASIVDALDGCKVVLLVLSSNSNQSRQVANEIERAVSKGAAILPLRIENVAPSKELELHVSNRHWLDAVTPPFEQHLERLAEVVWKLVGANAVVDESELTEESRGAAAPSQPSARSERRTQDVATSTHSGLRVTAREQAAVRVREPGPSRPRHLEDYIWENKIALSFAVVCSVIVGVGVAMATVSSRDEIVDVAAASSLTFSSIATVIWWVGFIRRK